MPGTGGPPPGAVWFVPTGPDATFATCAAPSTLTQTFTVVGGTTTTGTARPVAPRISDADVERIARRVAELIKAP